MCTERLWSVVVAAVCAAGVAMTATAAPRADRPVPDAVRSCATRGDSNRPSRPPASGAITIGPLILWPSIRNLGPTSNKTWPYAAKVPVMLPARARALLTIAPEAVGTAGLWNMRGGYVSSVRFLACREREPARAYRGTVGKYTQFPFAVALKETSACIPMEVWVDGEATPYRLVVPVGRSAC